MPAGVCGVCAGVGSEVMVVNLRVCVTWSDGVGHLSITFSDMSITYMCVKGVTVEVRVCVGGVSRWSL